MPKAISPVITHNYVSEWTAAVERTKCFGLTVPHHQVEHDRRYLGEKQLAEFPHVVRRALGELDLDDVVAQCLLLNYRLAPVMMEWLGCPVLYTLGWIDDGDGGMFKFDDSFIGDKLKNGQPGSSISMHAWLTLPSMEVIDMTLATSMSVIQKLPGGQGGVIASHADQLQGIAYKPMLVGLDFMRKAGLLLETRIYTH